MKTNTQSDYALRYTGNYFDQVDGRGYHNQPLTFHEFLSKPESFFMYSESFMQIPGYVQQESQIKQIEDAARQYVVEYIMDEFEHNLLGMQDYVRWAKLFEHRCAEITPSFWAQVNMHDLMYAQELETDDNTVTRTNTGGTSRTGVQTTTTDQNASSSTIGKTSTKQDTENTQDTDSSSREATATVVRANDQLTDELEYNWSDAADNVHEVLSRAGDTRQHAESTTDSESETNSQSHSVSSSSMENTADQVTSTGNEISNLTNKMFMQEKQWAINTARDLFPLAWLRAQLRPMFYLLY